MGVFKNLFDRWALKKQKKELTAFTSNLQAVDGPELGLVVAIATHLRHQLEIDGHNILDPINYFSIRPEFPYFLSTTIIQFQKERRTQEAAGLMIWLHTFRSAARLELRALGRNMWKELERGFPYVEEGAAGYRVMMGIDLNVEGAESFPLGLTPEPI